jgi:phosphatidylserine synthase
VITLGLSMIFLMPNLYLVTGLPITAPLAAVVLFWALVVKLVRDPDDDPRAFRMLSFLLILASVLYIVPQVYGMEAADQEYLGSLPSMLISVENLDLARPILWLSLGLFSLTGAGIFVRFLLRLGTVEEGIATSARTS